MQKYRTVTEKDIKESKIMRIGKILPLFLNDSYDNIMIFDTDEQKEFYRGCKDDMPRECNSWVIESWDLQLIDGKPYICFNATWNDYDE